MENAKAMTEKELTKKIITYLKKWHPGTDWKVIVKSDYDNYTKLSWYGCYIRTEKEKVSIDKGKYAVDCTSASTAIDALQTMYDLLKEAKRKMYALVREVDYEDQINELFEEIDENFANTFYLKENGEIILPNAFICADNGEKRMYNEQEGFLEFVKENKDNLTLGIETPYWNVYNE
ncbi:MAG: hypothetical protein IKP65_03520 [Alphaproteobacteria bacterium]|nr:hypothetical protein [Alphaproteobacteria bacterium]